jgi:hypothetical protein
LRIDPERFLESLDGLAVLSQSVVSEANITEYSHGVVGIFFEQFIEFLERLFVIT